MERAFFPKYTHTPVGGADGARARGETPLSLTLAKERKGLPRGPDPGLPALQATTTTTQTTSQREQEQPPPSQSGALLAADRGLPEGATTTGEEQETTAAEDAEGPPRKVTNGAAPHSRTSSTATKTQSRGDTLWKKRGTSWPGDFSESKEN